jgi:CheY-like chemotaxis protein
VSATILVVDDEADVEALFRQQFRREIRDGRFKIDFARSGDEALRLIEALAGTTLVLILSDINMPGMSGLNLLPKVRAARPDVPVIMITAYGDAETKTNSSRRRRRSTVHQAHRFPRAQERHRGARPNGRVNARVLVDHNEPDSRLLMLWTAPPPAQECHGWGRC